MNWQTVGLLTIAFFAIGLLHSRTLPHRRRAFLLVWLVVAVLIYRWANFRSAWREVGLAAIAALGLFIGWWMVYGKKLSTPTDESIRVWSEDDPF